MKRSCVRSIGGIKVVSILIGTKRFIEALTTITIHVIVPCRRRVIRPRKFEASPVVGKGNLSSMLYVPALHTPCLITLGSGMKSVAAFRRPPVMKRAVSSVGVTARMYHSISSIVPLQKLASPCCPPRTIASIVRGSGTLSPSAVSARSRWVSLSDSSDRMGDCTVGCGGRNENVNLLVIERCTSSLRSTEDFLFKPSPSQFAIGWLRPYDQANELHEM